MQYSLRTKISKTSKSISKIIYKTHPYPRWDEVEGEHPQGAVVALSSFWKSERLFTFLSCLLQPLTLFWIEVIHINIKHAIYRFLEAINQLLSTLEQWCQSDVKQQLLTILHGRRAAPDWLTSMAASTTMATSYWPTLLLTLLSPALLLSSFCSLVSFNKNSAPLLNGRIQLTYSAVLCPAPDCDGPGKVTFALNCS